MDRRSFLSGVAATGAAVASAGCAGVLAGDYDVGMSANAFEPARYVVEVGDAVTWTNTSSRGHTVTAYGDSLPQGAAYFATGGFESERAAREAWDSGAERDGVIGPWETFAHTFEVRGEFPYVCLPHERAGMDGVIVVE